MRREIMVDSEPLSTIASTGTPLTVTFNQRVGPIASAFSMAVMYQIVDSLLANWVFLFNRFSANILSNSYSVSSWGGLGALLTCTICVLVAGWLFPGASLLHFGQCLAKCSGFSHMWQSLTRSRAGWEAGGLGVVLLGGVSLLLILIMSRTFVVRASSPITRSLCLCRGLILLLMLF